MKKLQGGWVIQKDDFTGFNFNKTDFFRHTIIDYSPKQIAEECQSSYGFLLTYYIQKYFLAVPKARNAAHNENCVKSTPPAIQLHVVDYFLQLLAVSQNPE
jgi:hypothetical protein